MEIAGRRVAYLSRDHARSLRAMLKAQQFGKCAVRVRARIVGGWKTNESEGHYGIKLDLPADL